MGDSEDEFIWTSREELQDATKDELIEEVIALQQHVRTLESDISELESDISGLKELVYLVLDIQAGIGDKFHPELYAHLETLGEDDNSGEKAELESDGE